MKFTIWEKKSWDSFSFPIPQIAPCSLVAEGNCTHTHTHTPQPWLPPSTLLPFPLPCSDRVFPCLHSPGHRSSTRALCHVKYLPVCFACVLQFWERHELKQFTLQHLLLRNASKIITCPTPTLCSEMIS